MVFLNTALKRGESSQENVFLHDDFLRNVVFGGQNDDFFRESFKKNYIKYYFSESYDKLQDNS